MSWHLFPAQACVASSQSVVLLIQDVVEQPGGEFRSRPDVAKEFGDARLRVGLVRQHRADRIGGVVAGAEALAASLTAISNAAADLYAMRQPLSAIPASVSSDVRIRFALFLSYLPLESVLPAC